MSDLFTATNLLLLLLLHLLPLILWRPLRKAYRHLRPEFTHEPTSSTHLHPLPRLGISILYAPTQPNLPQLENLLSSEYPFMEVILTMDKSRDREFFRNIVSRYHLMRMGWQPTHEIPNSPVREVWRSLEPRFRRLVVVDSPSPAITPHNPDSRFALFRKSYPHPLLNAAASVASFEYLFPYTSTRLLRWDAIENLTAQLGERAISTPQCLYNHPLPTAWIISREIIVREKGFSRFLLFKSLGKSSRRKHFRKITSSIFLPPNHQYLTQLSKYIQWSLLLLNSLLLGISSWLFLRGNSFSAISLLLIVIFATLHLLKERMNRPEKQDIETTQMGFNIELKEKEKVL